jgi:hypothetical protein
MAELARRMAKLRRNAGKNKLSVGCRRLVLSPLGVLQNRYVITAVESRNMTMAVIKATLPIVVRPRKRWGVFWKSKPRTPVLMVIVNQAQVKCFMRSRTGHL